MKFTLPFWHHPDYVLWAKSSPEGTSIQPSAFPHWIAPCWFNDCLKFGSLWVAAPVSMLEEQKGLDAQVGNYLGQSPLWLRISAILKEWLKIHGNMCAGATLRVYSLFLLHVKERDLGALLISWLTKITCKILAVKKIQIISYHWEIPNYADSGALSVFLTFFFFL